MGTEGGQLERLFEYLPAPQRSVHPDEQFVVGAHDDNGAVRFLSQYPRDDGYPVQPRHPQVDHRSPEYSGVSADEVERVYAVGGGQW